MRKINAINVVSMIIDIFILLCSYLVATYIRFDLMYGTETALNIVPNIAHFIYGNIGQNSFEYSKETKKLSNERYMQIRGSSTINAMFDSPLTCLLTSVLEETILHKRG